MTAASDLFDLLESQETGVIDRYEVSSTPFAELRRNLRQLIQSLQESEGPDQELRRQAQNPDS